MGAVAEWLISGCTTAAQRYIRALDWYFLPVGTRELKLAFDQQWTIFQQGYRCFLCHTFPPFVISVGFHIVYRIY
jgi:hypothetical protein